MKKTAAFIFLSGLALSISSCSDHSRPQAHASAQEQQLNDHQIINILYTVDKGEINVSKEALDHDLNPAVKDYANYIIQDHEKNEEHLNELEKQLDLDAEDSAISDTLKNESKKGVDALDDLDDAAVSKAYIDQMIKDHQAGLQLIDTKLIPGAKNPQLRAEVERFRAMVAEHLRRALALQNTL